MDRRGAALIDIHLAGEQRLRGCGGAQRAEVDGQAAFAEVTGFVRQQDRQIERTGGRDGDFEPGLFRFEICSLRRVKLGIADDEQAHQASEIIV